MAQEKKERQISEMSIHERLARMQDEMKAPKSQYNKFGDFIIDRLRIFWLQRNRCASNINSH